METYLSTIPGSLGEITPRQMNKRDHEDDDDDDTEEERDFPPQNAHSDWYGKCEGKDMEDVDHIFEEFKTQHEEYETYFDTGIDIGSAKVPVIDLDLRESRKAKPVARSGKEVWIPREQDSRAFRESQTIQDLSLGPKSWAYYGSHEFSLSSGKRDSLEESYEWTDREEELEKKSKSSPRAKRSSRKH